VRAVHPIELLRHVARSGGGRRGHDAMAGQAVLGLAALAEDDPAAMVTACRLLMERYRSPGLVHQVCSRMLEAADPIEEADLILEELELDERAAW
jgi:hypothetical protein